jgi:protease I
MAFVFCGVRWRLRLELPQQTGYVCSQFSKLAGTPPPPRFARPRLTSGRHQFDGGFPNIFRQEKFMKLANLSGKTIAIMVASGFDETGFIAIQRVMMQAGAKLRIISREVGLTNAWNGSGWGMSYPADSTLSTALAIDYDGLIVPAGKRHIDTLQNEAHAKRVLRAFLREDMPVLLQGEATALLQLIDDDADRPNATADEAIPDGANAAPVVDGRLVTVATASAELPELQAFDAAVGAAIDESCAA